MTLAELRSQILDLLDLTIRPLQSSAYTSTCRTGILDMAIANALRWLSLHAPVDLLDGSDEVGADGIFLTDGTTGMTVDDGEIELPSDFVRLSRVRAASWHKAVSEAIYDTSDKALMLSDAIARATADRPVAVLSCKENKILSLHPYDSDVDGTGVGEEIELTSVRMPLAQIAAVLTGSAAAVIPLPPKCVASLLYQSAGYTLATMRDSDAKMFFDIAGTFVQWPQTPR